MEEFFTELSGHLSFQWKRWCRGSLMPLGFLSQHLTKGLKWRPPGPTTQHLKRFISEWLLFTSETYLFHFTPVFPVTSQHPQVWQHGASHKRCEFTVEKRYIPHAFRFTQGHLRHICIHRQQSANKQPRPGGCVWPRPPTSPPPLIVRMLLRDTGFDPLLITAAGVGSRPVCNLLGWLSRHCWQGQNYACNESTGVRSSAMVLQGEI